MGKHEPFSKGIAPDAWAKARRSDRTGLLQLLGQDEPVEAVASIGVVYGARAQPAGDRIAGGRVDRSRLPGMLVNMVEPALDF